MPLGCGFVGVVPALEYLLTQEETPGGDASIVSAFTGLVGETGGLRLPLGKLVLWALGLCFFGVVFAVPLRREVIVREKLKFPSGTATALMIGVLHGGEKTGVEGEVEAQAQVRRRRGGSKHVGEGDRGRDEESQALMGGSSMGGARQSVDRTDAEHPHGYSSSQSSVKDDDALKRDWKAQIRLLTYSFGVSGVYVRSFLSSIAIPKHSLPFLLPHRIFAAS